MSSKKLASIAWIIWFCSLALPGLIFHSSNPPILLGYQILLIGWLSPLSFNFAWFANILFWCAVLELLSAEPNSSPIKVAILAVLLSFDTFWFTLPYISDEKSGYGQPVDGYGWGAVLWFIAIFLLLAAVGIRQQEIREEPQLPNAYEWLRPLGFFLVILAIGVSSYFSIQDRIGTNSTELKRLSVAAFKRGTVCRVPDPVIRQPIRNFSGTLEIIINGNTGYGNFTFNGINENLKKTISSVHFVYVDNSIDLNMYENRLLSEPAVDLHAAILEESYTEKEANVKLIEVGTNRIIFNQTWQKERTPWDIQMDYYCPDFFIDQSTQLIMQALGLSETRINSQNKKQATSVGNIQAPLHDKLHL